MYTCIVVLFETNRMIVFEEKKERVFLLPKEAKIKKMKQKEENVFFF